MKTIRRCVIVKIGDTDFVKYRYVDNLVKFTDFLDRKYPNWRYMNVFDRDTKEQIANFSKKNRPISHI